MGIIVNNIIFCVFLESANIFTRISSYVEWIAFNEAILSSDNELIDMPATAAYKGGKIRNKTESNLGICTKPGINGEWTIEWTVNLLLVITPISILIVSFCSFFLNYLLTISFSRL